MDRRPRPGASLRSLPSLIEAVQLLLDTPVANEPSPPLDPSVAPGTVMLSSWRWVIAAGAFLSLAFGYFIVDKLWLSKPVAVEKPVAAVTPAIIRAPPAIPEKSIAVLPFVDMSEKKDQEYFADGIAEETLGLLATVPQLKVIGRTSSFQFKGKNQDIRTIGKQLGAAYLLEGSVRKSGDRVRVTAQLIDTRTGAHQWSETFDRQFGDVLRMEDEIAAGVAVALAITFYADDPRKLANPEAYDLYLRGLHSRYQNDKVGLEAAVDYSRQALDLDPSFAPAALLLANTYLNQAAFQYIAPREGFPRARRALESYVKLFGSAASPDIRAIIHGTLAYINVVFEWDWAAADQELQQAFVLAPHNETVHQFSAELTAATGRWDEAVRYANLAIAQDPLSASLYETLGSIRYRTGRFEEAEVALRRALQISPTFGWGHSELAWVLLAQGRREEALAATQQEDPEDRNVTLAIVYASMSRKSESDKALAQAIKDSGDLAAMDIAGAYACRGELQSAFAWLERAYQQKDAELFRFKGHPLLKNLEHDPRYKAFLRKMNLPE